MTPYISCFIELPTSIQKKHLVGFIFPPSGSLPTCQWVLIISLYCGIKTHQGAMLNNKYHIEAEKYIIVIINMFLFFIFCDNFIYLGKLILYIIHFLIKEKCLIVNLNWFMCVFFLVFLQKSLLQNLRIFF